MWVEQAQILKNNTQEALNIIYNILTEEQINTLLQNQKVNNLFTQYHILNNKEAEN